MISFKDYLEEKQLSLFGSLNIFDIDDTLMHTTAQIAVVKDGKKIADLTNQEFNNYKLKPGESFDFSQFKDSQKFHDESKPIKRMFEKVKKILGNQNSPSSKTIILTARSNFDDRDLFLQGFRRHGFPIDQIRVERAGNIEGPETPASKKAQIVSKYLDSGLYNKTRLFDDSMSNLKAFLALRDKYSHVKFEAYFANPDGSIRTIK